MYEGCLTAQANRPETQTKPLSVPWTFSLRDQPQPANPIKTPPPWRSDAVAGSKAGKRELTRCRRRSGQRLPQRPRGRGGARAVTDADITWSDHFIESSLTERLKEIEACFGADVIACIHPIVPPFDDFVRQRVEDIPNKSANLLVLLETDGGSIETCERMADVFRHHYPGEVSFLIPNFAFSAGTILVMSGDRILMDYYSVLGPIDPQVQNSAGEWVPALGYLHKYNELIQRSKTGKMAPAELAFLLDKFDPAQLHRFEQAKAHGEDLLKKWLVQYKFKNWTTTETRQIAVTQAMKTQRAAEIAGKLNNTKLWRSHARGISMSVVRQTLNLAVEDYGAEPLHAELNRKVRAYYRLLQDYMARRGWGATVQTREGRFPI
jgi:hypothetical protein